MENIIHSLLKAFGNACLTEELTIAEIIPHESAGAVELVLGNGKRALMAYDPFDSKDHELLKGYMDGFLTPGEYFRKSFGDGRCLTFFAWDDILEDGSSLIALMDNAPGSGKRFKFTR